MAKQLPPFDGLGLSDLEPPRLRPKAPPPAPQPRRRPDRTGNESEAVPVDFAARPGQWITVECPGSPWWRGRLAVALFWLGYPVALIWGVGLVHWAFPGVCS